MKYLHTNPCILKFFNIFPPINREYVKKYDFVSSGCRLTTEEELLLLKMCTPSVGYRLPTELVNRNAYVSAVANIGTLPVGKTLSVKVGIDKPPVIDNFDGGADTSILDNPKNCLITSKLFGAAYSRPEEVSGDKPLDQLAILAWILSEYSFPNSHSFTINIPGSSGLWRLACSRVYKCCN